MKTRLGLRGLGLVLATVTMVGCAAQGAFRNAERQGRRENWDQAVLGFSKALALDPGNSRYELALERAKLRAAAQHFEKGKRYSAAAQWDPAVAEFQQTLLLNPGNQHASTELDRALMQIRRRDATPSDIERLKEKAKRDAMAPPKLDPKSNIAIMLSFRDQPIGKIFDAISKASGLNFIYDDKTDLVKPFTIEVGNVTLEKALDILMLQTKNFYKVIDEATLLIAPDSRQKRQELDDQVIQTFYLSNAETKQVVTVIRTLLNARQVAENDQLNSVTIKETPDKVAIAERIIQANDKSKGEIVIDVELLEINRTVARTLGIDLSSKTMGLTFKDGKQSIPLNNLSVLKQQGNWLLGVIPSVVVNFLKSDSDSRTIAKPQLRVTEGEKAEILIGERVPIPTTSFNTSQTIGGNIVPITSYTYQNVGITLSLEPRVHHNKEVTLKVKVEVSSITGAVQTGQGAQPIIGTRQIETVIRLKDGETNMLAGLIKREDQDTRSGVAGISDIPGLGRILGNSEISKKETDIILTLTPYIVRIPDITEDDLGMLWVGTEENMRLRGPARNALNASPFGTIEDKLGLNGTSAEGGAEGGAAAEPPAPELSKSPSPPKPATGRPSAGAAASVPATTVQPPSPPAPPPVPEEAAPQQGEEEIPPDTTTPEGEEEPPPESSPAEPDTPRGPATVRLVPSAPSFSVGEPVIVEVRIEGAQSVGSVPFHLRYNRQVLEFLPQATTEGPFLKSDGINTVFLANDAGGGGQIVVGHSRLGGGQGISGSGLLATFRFQAVNPGDCGFSFAAQSVRDSQARTLPSVFLPAAVTVAP